MNNLENILNELSHYHRDKSQLLTYYIQLRLNKSLETYYKKVTDSFNYLKYKDDLKVAKRLNKD